MASASNTTSSSASTSVQTAARQTWPSASRWTSASLGHLRRDRRWKMTGLLQSDVEMSSATPKSRCSVEVHEDRRHRRLFIVTPKARRRITRSGETQARLLRDNVLVHEGKISSLRRFKDDVEQKWRTGCDRRASALANYNDIKVGDVIEVFSMERVAIPV